LLELGDIVEIPCDENTFALRARTWLHDVVSVWIGLHCFLQFSSFVWQDKGLRDEGEMLCSMFGFHTGKMFIQAVFSRNFSGLWPMINLLKFSKRLIHN